MNVVIADHQAIFRTGIARVLAAEDDIRIVDQPQCLGLLRNLLERFRVHLLLITAGFSAAPFEIQLLAASHSTAVLGLADDGNEAAVLIAMGVKGMVYRSVQPGTFVDAVRRLTCGKSFMHTPNSNTTEIGEDHAGSRVRDRLSPRELRIVAAVARGYKNREVAMLVRTSEQMVKSTLTRIFIKVGVSDRLELLLYVLHHRSLGHAAAAPRLELDPKTVKLLAAARSKDLWVHYRT